MTSSPWHKKTYATSDYGSPTGGQVTENVSEQGANPSADKEHPGPPPPKVGQGTGQSGTKAGAEGNKTGGVQQSDKRPSMGNEKTQGSSEGGSKGFATFARARYADGGESKPQPKILQEERPKEGEEPQDVKEHNEEFAKRPETVQQRAQDEEFAKKEEKVEKGYWKGDAGPKDGPDKQAGQK